MLEILGTVIGFIYLWLEYKASIKVWIVGIIMPAIYIFVFFRAGLYADFGMNIYYLLAALYGYIGWKYQSKKGTKTEGNDDLPITHAPVRLHFFLVIIVLVAWALIYYILKNFTDSNVPIADSFINALSIIALWMLAKKYVEQWIPWIIIDAISSGLFVYKELYFTSVLYTVYTIVAIFGYYKWKKMAETDLSKQ
jgi:nicotinamide mononucleotide transporter